MTYQGILKRELAQQVPNRRSDGQQCPTPVEIRTALYTVLIEDADNPNTPHIPVHINALIREAITRANAGEFQ